MYKKINTFEPAISLFIASNYSIKQNPIIFFEEDFFKDPYFLKILRERTTKAMVLFNINFLPSFVFNSVELAVEAIKFPGKFSKETNPEIFKIAENKDVLLSYTESYFFNHPTFIEMCPMSLFSDKDFCLSISSNSIYSCVPYFSEDFLSEKSFVLELAKKSGTSIKHISCEKLLEDKDVCLAYSKTGSSFTSVMSKTVLVEIFNDNSLFLELLSNTQDYLFKNKNSRYNIGEIAYFFNVFLNHNDNYKLLNPQDVQNSDVFELNDVPFKRFFYTISNKTFFDLYSQLSYILDIFISKCNRKDMYKDLTEIKKTKPISKLIKF